jgi:hypothetical protein
MAKRGRISFRKQPRETGLSSIANPRPSTDIKLDGKVIGSIIAPSRFGRDQEKWRIGIMADKPPTGDDPCPWGWRFWQNRFDSEPDAREWFVSVAWPAISERYTFKARMEEAD